MVYKTFHVLFPALLFASGPAHAQELDTPVRLEAAGTPIDTAVGHAAPWVCDIDGDGVQDLLVGQFGDGTLWVHRNEGTNAEPRLAARVEFEAGGKEGRVPAG